jgi:two-component system NtrC family sensor kinase
VALLDNRHEDLVIKKTLSNQKDWVYQASQVQGEGLLGLCMQTGQAVLVNQPKNDPRLVPGIDVVPDIETTSLLYVPLRIQNNVIGALQLQNKPGGFTVYDQHLLASLSGALANLFYYLQVIQNLRVENAHLEASRWELIRSRNTLRSLFDNMPDSLYIIDANYRMVAVNLARAQRAQRDTRGMVGELCYEGLFNRNEPCEGCVVADTFFNRRLSQRTVRYWADDGEPQEWAVSAYPIFDETDQVVQAILFEQDVTDKKRMEMILAQSEKLAAVGQLAAGIAHEINNPLTVILANAQLLQRDLADDNEAQESVDLILRASSRAQHAVRNLLNFARKEQIEFIPIDINTTIRNSLDMVKHELISRGAELLFEPEEELPPIKASADHLQGVWLNIILNALDATEAGKGRIRVMTHNQGNEVRVIITDNGHGIPPENLKRIFEPFYTTKDPGRGTGLGLSVCHRIIKQHGGRILVDSKMGQGTTFLIIFPVY